MKYPFIVCIMLVSFSLKGQSMKDALGSFERGQLDSAIAISKKFTGTDPGAYQVIGQALVKQGKYNDAIPYLEKGRNSINAEPSIRAWCMHDLGIAYFMQGNYARAKENIKACIELNATKNSVRSANGAANLFGLSELYDNWTRKETKHFVFHFQHLQDNADLYMAASEAAYDSINRFFRAVLPKKIDYFVWDDQKLAENVFHQPLAFTKTVFCVTHTAAGHTRGHEIAHSISMYATVIRNPNKLIFEGLACYFDFSGRDWVKEAKKMVLGHGGRVSITDTWKSGEHLPEGILYPLGAALCGKLIQSFGRDRFILLLADQSYENAKKIYGTALDDLIVNLEKEINGN